MNASARPTLANPTNLPYIMGVLNVTPDSFSDGGRYINLDQAIAHARQMHADGADIIDVGGESTRPGAKRVDAPTEIERVLPVIRALAEAKVPTSIDTTRAAVAAEALHAGASMINDVSGGLADENMAKLAAETTAKWVLMHWRGHSDRMADLATYDDVVKDVRAELSARIDAAIDAGVRPENLIIDPGIGFAKNPAHNWRLLAHLDELIGLNYPVLVGASRKSFLGTLLSRLDPAQRDAATTAISLLAAQSGVWGLRVHDVRSTVDALATAQAWKAAR